ncbi:MAG TPA: F0F1 ATP synthase subunit epsilon [Nitrospiraceae bacterium]|jgi:F-type H+-transporting ATPase subunit epsilon|nr:F0F1 ATP synthase subunit epsilon [Nitrospiraceae bacterium]
MDNTITLEIVTPYGLIFSGDIDEITATGSEGEFGVFPGHAHFLTTLRVGMLTCKRGSEILIFFVSGGYAEVMPDKVTILADSAERSEDIDVERARTALKRAEERLKQAEKIDFARATAAVERATIRVQIAEKHQAK